ncbi:MAG: CHAT domain-containing protein [Candidatus Rhabdochlamydia sp.]
MDRETPSFHAWIISSDQKPLQSISLPILDHESFKLESIFGTFPYKTPIKRPQGRGKQPTDVFKEKLSSWYRSLIAPLKDFLPAKDSGKTLTVIPDGFLAHLPFGAFYDAEEKFYLIEKYPVSTTPSLKVLSLLSQFPKESLTQALLVGNPTTPIDRDNNLEHVEAEVQEVIAPMMKDLKTHVFLKQEAIPNQIFKGAPSAQFVHIACHGVVGQPLAEKLYPSSVFDGFFKLARDDTYLHGQLHAKEVASMTLKTDLVLMSACHLGRGTLKREGSIGLVRSFLGAGAKSTIASYWPLPEGEVTVKMVDVFYRHYLGIGTSKVNKAQALRQAVLDVMKTERNKPRQWGHFSYQD